MSQGQLCVTTCDTMSKRIGQDKKYNKNKREKEYGLVTPTAYEQITYRQYLSFVMYDKLIYSSAYIVKQSDVTLFYLDD